MVAISISERKQAASSKSAVRRQEIIKEMKTAANQRSFSVDTVVSPYKHERLDHLAQQVVRVLDPIDRLYSLKRINQAQKSAAEKYRTAYEYQAGRLSGTLDPNKVGGGGNPGSRFPPEESLAASNLLYGANTALGKIVGPIVEYIAGNGCTIQQCATFIYGENRNRDQVYNDRKYVGRQLNDGLTALAELWGLDAENRSTARKNIRGVRHGPQSTVLNLEIVKPAVVAHAGPGGKIRYSGS